MKRPIKSKVIYVDLHYNFLKIVYGGHFGSKVTVSTILIRQSAIMSKFILTKLINILVIDKTK